MFVFIFLLCLRMITWVFCHIRSHLSQSSKRPKGGLKNSLSHSSSRVLALTRHGSAQERACEHSSTAANSPGSVVTKVTADNSTVDPEKEVRSGPL